MRVVISILLLITVTISEAQYLPGMSAKEIEKHMNTKFSNFDVDDGAKNNTYKYIKYVDKYNEETMLVFLDDKNICTHTKLMSDFSNEENRRKELDKKCTKINANSWEYSEKGTIYSVTYLKEDWYFTIVTKKKK